MEILLHLDARLIMQFSKSATVVTNPYCIQHKDRKQTIDTFVQ